MSGSIKQNQTFLQSNLKNFPLRPDGRMLSLLQFDNPTISLQNWVNANNRINIIILM